MKCIACGVGELVVFFEALQVPVFCNVLHDTPESAKSASRGDIRLAVCDHCGMIYNVAFDPDLVEYAVGYENSLHGSPLFQQFAEDLAERLVKKYEIRNQNIFEIGPGRGEFLELICAAGDNRGIGYDPSAPDDVTSLTDGPFRIVRELFDPDKTEVEGQLICSRHVLEHISEPRAFAEMLGRAKARNPEVGIYIEVPNALWTLRDLGVWDIIYEHCSYFTPPSLRSLLQSGGLEHITTIEEFGGQFLSAETESAPVDADPAAELEEVLGLVSQFSQRYQEEVGRWNRELTESAQAGKKMALWGAGSKGVTFLNTIENADSVACIVDINDRKHGKFVAGTGHPIVAPEGLLEHGVDTVVIMNPNYWDEIKGMLDSIGFQGEMRSIDQS